MQPPTPPLPPLPNLTLRSFFTVGLLVALVWAVAAGAAAFGVADLRSSAGLIALGSLGAFVGAPVVFDVMLSFVYASSRVPLDALPPELGGFIRSTCESHNMRPPKLFVIHDSTPTAFTYGWSPSTARVVYSEGLLELLSPLEARAVFGHELGHVKRWDILVATVAAAISSFIAAAIERVEVLLEPGRTSEGVADDDGPDRGDESDSGSKSRSLRGIFWVCRGLVVAAELIELSLSRTRELHADRFGARACGSAAAMARALIKISYGLTSVGSTGAPKVSGALQVQGAGPAALMARSVPDSAAPEGADALQYAMAWDLWNPWARACELLSTHPTTARRLISLEPVSRLQGEAPAVSFSLEQTRSLWRPFLVDVVFAAAPAAVGLWAGWVFVRSGIEALGLPLLAVGVALGAKTWFRYRGPTFEPGSVATLLSRLEASPVRGVPCRLEGTLIGRGEPGLVWNDDYTFRDDTGIVVVDHRQPLAIWEFLWGLFGAYRYIGGSVVLEGWFRRGPVPYVEVKRMWIDDRVLRSYARWIPWSAAALCVIAGVLSLCGVLVPIFEGVRDFAGACLGVATQL